MLMYAPLNYELMHAHTVISGFLVPINILCSTLDHCFRCLYISGVPGTGKTATVHEVMCSLKEAEEEGLVPQFKFVEINGMRMTDPYQTYPLIWKVCGCGCMLTVVGV